MQIALAPMEGLVDPPLRDLLTRVGGIDWCVTEFIRVTDRLLPKREFYRLAPELHQGGKTAAGVPVRVQLLGSDPMCLGENADRACQLGAPVVDLNFGCPAKTVNRHKGGAVLLKEPEALYEIVQQVRASMPAHVPLTAKMRLGYEDAHLALDCARALADAGAAEIIVHARTKVQGYKPPAHWSWIARIAEVVSVPVMANGEIWSVEDYRRCVAECGISDVMLGRGLVSRPGLARQIAAEQRGTSAADMTWSEVLPLVLLLWQDARERIAPRHAPGRIKQWLAMLSRFYPEANELFARIKRLTALPEIDVALLTPVGLDGLTSNALAQ
ncbi:tRNA dihydrouridine synthase [Atopomonas sediminilitoris]|uniref:tRNA dihydrouridine synthase n=1 Tax=Atopomonas sediminilitoris TaxID=2919919 RepID=UPI001F4F0F0E|nr:tRNA-dihydrouridine synthase [Atopomonas sediminilitoris]MCJ8168101.1 tRNA-dihydrouridine synthase [Atopomonas sediminilitoris]